MNELQTQGAFTESGFKKNMEIATELAKSGIIPKEYQNNQANCLVALEVAARTGSSPLAVMQNLNVIQGRPSWSSQYIIASVNSTGKFSPLRFKIESENIEREIEYTETVWINQQKTKVQKKIRIKNKTCFAYATDKATGDVIEGPATSLEMAVKEGWYTKEGSKWQTMDEIMLRYRAAAFFGRLYAPEILIGLQTTDEIIDTSEKEIQGVVKEVSRTETLGNILTEIVPNTPSGLPTDIPVDLLSEFKSKIAEAESLDALEEISENYRGKFATAKDNKEAKTAYSARQKELTASVE